MHVIKLKRNDTWLTLRNHDGSPKGFESSETALNHAETKGYFGAFDIDIVEIEKDVD